MSRVFRTFRGDSFDEAYQLMLREMGPDAVVINTKEVAAGGVMGILSRKRIELTASGPAPDDGSPMPNAPVRPTGRARSLPEKRYRQTAATSANMPGPPGVGSDDTVRETVDYFKRIVSEAQARIAQNTPHEAPTPANAAKPAAASSKPAAAPSAPSAQSEAAPAADGAGTDDRVEALQREVRAIRQMLQVLVAETPGSAFPPEFAPHYRKLLDHGVCRELAADLVSTVIASGDRNVLKNRLIFRERLKLEIQRRIRVTGGLGAKRGRPRTVALIGATGVGKTTNLAKLAALHAVRDELQVGLITTDTYRVAAPEQLNVYARIIGLPMKIANCAEEFVQALKDFSHCDLVLIDTAGGSQFNATQIGELKNVLDAGRLDEVVLVLSANTQLEDLRTSVQNFACLRPTSLLFSKLDETRRFGGMLTIAAETKLPLGHFSIGQGVPDDIELATAGKVAKLIA